MPRLENRRRAGFQAQNALPAFATYTYRTDDVMRSETLTVKSLSDN
jgi:hypothetical protein